MGDALKALEAARERLGKRVDDWKHNTDNATVGVRLGDLRAIMPTLAAPQEAGGVKALTIAELQRAHVERQEEWCPDQKPDLSFRGNEMAGETGEACNVIKKLERERHGWRGSRATKADLADELADVVHTAVLCAITAGIDLEPAVVAKFNATSEKNGLASRLLALDPGGVRAEPLDDVRELLRMIDNVQSRPSHESIYGIYNPKSPMGQQVEKVRAALAAPVSAPSPSVPEPLLYILACIDVHADKFPNPEHMRAHVEKVRSWLAAPSPSVVEGLTEQIADDERSMRSSLKALAAQTAPGWRSRAADDVLAERRRQVEAEGWTPEHDDQHDRGSIVLAAVTYAMASLIDRAERAVMDEFGTWDSTPYDILKFWPWDRKWWKPKSRRRDLVRAGALILAEIERLDRLPASPSTTETQGGANNG